MRGAKKLTETQTVANFWSRVRSGSQDECWEWLAGLAAGGYGCFHYRGKNRKAHRVSYALAKGPIPVGKHVCHSCDNPKCCNPRHLWLGSQKENVADMIAKGRSKLRRGDKGEDHPSVKLTAAAVMEIFSNARGTQREIAARYGIAQTTVSDIRRGRRWGHLTGKTP